MSKLGRKARNKEEVQEEGAKKVLIYLAIGLVILAVILGVIFS